MKPGRPRILLSCAIMAAFAGWIAFYVGSHREAFSSAAAFDLRALVALFALYVLLLFLHGDIIRLLVNKLGGRVSRGEGFAMSVMTHFANYIVPFRGGAAVRAAYLKRAHAFDYASFLATLGGYYLVLFLVVSASALAVSGWLFASRRIVSAPVTAVFTALFLLLLGILLFNPGRRALPSWLPPPIVRVAEGWGAIKGDRGLVATLVMLNLLIVAAGSAFIHLFFLAAGAPVPIAFSLYLNLVPYLSFFINVTPAAFGVYDSAFFLAAAILGLPAADSILFLALFRAVSFSSSALLFLLFGRRMYGAVRRREGGA